MCLAMAQLCIAHMRQTQGARAGGREMRERDDMHMIRHEVIGSNLQPIEHRILPEKLQLTEVIISGEKHLLPIISSQSQVMGNIDKNVARPSCHNIRLFERKEYVNN